MPEGRHTHGETPRRDFPPDPRQKEPGRDAAPNGFARDASALVRLGWLIRWAASGPRRRRAIRGPLKRISALLPAPPPCEPIFLIGAPRSGTTLLFDLVSRS